MYLHDVHLHLILALCLFFIRFSDKRNPHTLCVAYNCRTWQWSQVCIITDHVLFVYIFLILVHLCAMWIFNKIAISLASGMERHQLFVTSVSINYFVSWLRLLKMMDDFGKLRVMNWRWPRIVVNSLCRLRVSLLIITRCKKWTSWSMVCKSVYPSKVIFYWICMQPVVFPRF